MRTADPVSQPSTEWVNEAGAAKVWRNPNYCHGHAGILRLLSGACDRSRPLLLTKSVSGLRGWGSHVRGRLTIFVIRKLRILLLTDRLKAATVKVISQVPQLNVKTLKESIRRGAKRDPCWHMRCSRYTRF
jgi:hypothetical protein